MPDFCEAHQTHELAVHALAVPLRDARGETLAALNVVVGASGAEAARLRRELLPAMQEAARALRPLL